MSKYRNNLPQLGSQVFITDGGLETTLIFHDGIDLPFFASFDLLKDATGTDLLRRYFERYAKLARRYGVGLVLETPTWRANPDWAAKLGYDAPQLAEVNRKAVAQLSDIRKCFEAVETPIVISGNLGPRGDGYRADFRMTMQQAREYHMEQIKTFAQTDADLVSAFTMNYPEEAIGIVASAKDSGMPIVISFTVETDGRLPSGESLQEAITLTDQATDRYALYYMINCAHPTHFETNLSGNGEWLQRIRGVRANASRKSHAELDESTELDKGDADELGVQYANLQARLPRLAVVGGCCGTDHDHVDAICRTMKGVHARELAGQAA